MFVRMIGLIAAVLIFIGMSAELQARQAKPGVFDYYVLSLSWSPTFCASDAGRREPRQCSPGRRFAFVVHGLWPQYERGWPAHCRTRERWVPDRQIRGMLDIMPSKRLIIHEWKKHGTCSGLPQDQYFELTRQLFGRIRIPARYLSPNDPVLVAPRQLVLDFVKTNHDLRSDMMSVQCGNSRTSGRLREVRICFNRRGEFTPCGVNQRRRCRARTLVLPPVR